MGLFICIYIRLGMEWVVQQGINGILKCTNNRHMFITFLCLLRISSLLHGARSGCKASLMRFALCKVAAEPGITVVG
jgi:hypothetical protein